MLQNMDHSNLVDGSLDQSVSSLDQSSSSLDQSALSMDTSAMTADYSRDYIELEGIFNLFWFINFVSIATNGWIIILFIEVWLDKLE